MTEKSRRITGTIALILGLVVLYVILLLSALHSVGTDDGLYYREQLAADILPDSGISDSDLRDLDARLADYLGGNGNALYEDVAGLRLTGENTTVRLQADVVKLLVFGQEQPAFNDREMTHMEDCFKLFALLRKVRGRLIPWAILLTLGGAWLLQDRRRARLCAWLSPLVLLLPLGAFALWAARDFNAAFNAFHGVLFSNDLWLLDPRTDLLIRICPASMFMHMGARIGVFSLIGILAVSAAATGITFLWPRGRGDDTWKDRDMRNRSANKRIDFGRTGTR